MKEKKVLTNKGFILVETLIVGVFIMGIFSLLYTNFFPLIGEYERYRDYDTVESTYIAHWARMIALKGLSDSSYSTASNQGYLDISDCNLYTESSGQADCAAFKTMNNISKIYLTPYSTVNFKNYIKDNSSFSRSFREYISYLPTYSRNTSKTPATGYYRVIVEYISNDTYNYSSIEVYKNATNYDDDSNLADIILPNPGPDGDIYDDGTDTFITGEDPNNYVWYSGKLWRAVSVNNQNKTVKLVSQWSVSAIPFNNNNVSFEGSHIESWLNDTSVDGFLGNLRDYENFLVIDAVWDATVDNTNIENIQRPDGTTTVIDTVGLLNYYEYVTSYRGTTYQNGYLNNKLAFWTLTPISDVTMRVIANDGSRYNYNPQVVYGVRPSVVLKANIKAVAGDGTINNPYRLEGDNDTNLSGTLLSSRYSGEYIRFGTGENNLYRIVSHENGTGTKITSAEPLTNSGQFLNIAFNSDDNVSFSSANDIGVFLNGEYLNNYLTAEDRNLIENNTTWYLGNVGFGENYKFSKYTDVDMTSTTTTTTNAKVGLLRLGELMAGQFDRNENNIAYWTLSPYSSRGVNVVNNDSTTVRGDNTTTFTYGIKPSLNLKSNVVITGGDGTINNPFTISLG